MAGRAKWGRAVSIVGSDESREAFGADASQTFAGGVPAPDGSEEGSSTDVYLVQIQDLQGPPAEMGGDLPARLRSDENQRCPHTGPWKKGSLHRSSATHKTRRFRPRARMG